MAAVLKKRALAEYNKSFQDGPSSKKLHLAKKPLIGSSAAAFVGLLEKCKSSDEALQLLLRISDCLQFQESDVEEAIKKLSEHFQSEEESVVRVKILWLFCDIGLECPGANLNHLIEETTHLIKNETSHKVIAQGIATLLKLGNKLSEDKILMNRLVGVARDNLKDTSHQVKCRCLQLISELYPICPEIDRTAEMIAEADIIVKLLSDYSNAEDARVRCEAFQSLLTLHGRGLTLSAQIYEHVCTALSDDYEIVREVALKLVWLLGNKYPENTVTLQDGETTMRLVDDAFIRICSAVNDLCMQVRALACTLLGTTKSVSDRFLLQTLDKQLMSNMKKKKTAHERGAELVRSGAWASGRRWADDAPGQLLEQATVQLLPGGAAGAFVHGLEDEFMEVRTAAVEAVCELSMENSIFATTSLDFLVDMFNDEIEDVRLRAIDSLTKISHHIVLREDQLETILGALEDYSMDVREGLHRMLGSCTVASKTCLEMCIDKILENLKRYPQDKRSTFRCVQRMGSKHATLVLPLTTRLLGVHPFFDMPEPDVEDPSYMCVLILVFNAAQHCTTMLPLFEEHTVKHYTYLRDTMPHLVPPLPIGDNQFSRNEKSETAMDDTAVRKFFDTVLQHIDNATLSTAVRMKMLHSAEEQLNKLAEMEPLVSGAAQFTALFARCVLALHAALARAPAPPHHALLQLSTDCLRLQHQFSGVSEQESACVWQLALRVSAAKLIAAVENAAVPGAGPNAAGTGAAPGQAGPGQAGPGTAGGSAAALTAAAALTHHAELLDRLLASAGMEPEPFTIAVFQQLSASGEHKPAALGRALLPLLLAAPPPLVPRPNLKIRMCTATIIEPATDNDTVLRFCAGLITGVAFEAEVLRVKDPSAIRIRVAYPDRRVHALVPPRDHLRPLDHQNTNDDDTENVRLLTKVLISHGVWTEPCGVDISVCLAVEEGSSREVAPLVELCRPVRVTVAPKPIKRGI
ncbi:integrator complex subunit 4 [Zerene cesonia]|uniref:integrator complex subunit 4 n=1 Tax=Zerene cesonia TaxID=33412 RepID=UPI0018E50617|nr:integrator complex subunit 4 [Zerene cesonia]